ncbi:hypothetical protein CT19431_80186 [Cupriavidus taiwanensis]|nr:hypothetical protein CT19431_80186 [Cupriavidus taiwanensis]
MAKGCKGRSGCVGPERIRHHADRAETSIYPN